MSVSLILTDTPAAPALPAAWSNLDVASIYCTGNITVGGTGSIILGPTGLFVGALGPAFIGVGAASTNISDGDGWVNIPVATTTNSRGATAAGYYFTTSGGGGIEVHGSSTGNLCEISVAAGLSGATGDTFVRISRDGGTDIIATGYLADTVPTNAIPYPQIFASVIYPFNSLDTITVDFLNVGGGVDIISPRLSVINMGRLV